jgi:hypothetical protein
VEPAAAAPGKGPSTLIAVVKEVLTSRQDIVDIVRTSRSKHPKTAAVCAGSGLTLILIGIALATLGPTRFDGFVKGFFMGAGVMLILIGVVVLSASWRAQPDRSWLPSRDE